MTLDARGACAGGFYLGSIFCDTCKCDELRASAGCDRLRAQNEGRLLNEDPSMAKAAAPKKKAAKPARAKTAAKTRKPRAAKKA